ncbi:MAG: sulfite exporter TauE/SafE family protein, partial [Chloroflexia bacterium]|nr:sulfite exporter TauE/SafE family protein [Chloroflexia bacterium]
VYTALGVVALALGAGLTEVSIPVFVAARKVLGPLMVVIGLGMVGVLRFRSAPEIGSVGRLRTLARQRAERAPMLLGVAFGFSFCPTLFGIFFGLLVPLALARPDGVVYPALFALGTAVPVLMVLTMLSLGGGSLRRHAGRIGRYQRVVAVLAGTLLVLAGLHDTVIYWLL